MQSSRHTSEVELSPHPLTPCDAVGGISVRVRVDGRQLSLAFSMHADFTRVRVPPQGSGARRDGLWKHTCFEAFVAPGSGEGYVELNFSPTHDWAIYDFSGYRAGMSPSGVTEAPQISTELARERLELRAVLRLDDLSALQSAQHLRLALATVVEDSEGRLSYWALRHAPGKPDFHHPSGFALEIETP